jgi:hypothetical protein
MLKPIPGNVSKMKTQRDLILCASCLHELECEKTIKRRILYFISLKIASVPYLQKFSSQHKSTRRSKERNRSLTVTQTCSYVTWVGFFNEKSRKVKSWLWLFDLFCQKSCQNVQIKLYLPKVDILFGDSLIKEPINSSFFNLNMFWA